MVYEPKHLVVDDDTKKRIMIFKARKDFKSVTEVIKHLLDEVGE